MRCAAGVARHPFHEVLDQQRDVLLAVAQGRNLQAEDVEAEVEVAAEGAVGDRRLQIAIGGGQDADVDVHALGAAHRTDFLFLDGAQQLGLQVDGQFADLVEKHGAAVGDGEQSFLGANRAGEGAAHVAEELAFDQRREPASRSPPG